MNKRIFHTRLVAQTLDQWPLLNGDVCIDVILRGPANEARKIADRLEAVLDGAGTDVMTGKGIGGMWAGIGRGEFVDGPVTLG